MSPVQPAASLGRGAPCAQGGRPGGLGLPRSPASPASAPRARACRPHPWQRRLQSSHPHYFSAILSERAENSRRRGRLGYKTLRRELRVSSRPDKSPGLALPLGERAAATPPLPALRPRDPAPAAPPRLRPCPLAAAPRAGPGRRPLLRPRFRAAPTPRERRVPRLSASAAGAGGDARSAEGARDAPPGKHRRLDRGAPEPQPPDRPTQPRTEPPPAAAAPSGDQGCWGAPPGPAEDGLAGGQRPGAPRHSPSGDAPHDPRAGPASDETPGPARPKPVSPVATSGPLRAPGGLPLPKDSKIPISVKHLASLPSSHPAAPQQPARSEVPRTKIPVSKVLVRRVSNRGLAGTSLWAAACHDSAKKL